MRRLFAITFSLLSVETPPAITTPDAPWLNWTLRRTGKTSHLIAVNNSPEAQSAVFTLPGAASAIRDHRRGQDLPQADAQVLQLDFAPFGLWLCAIDSL